jgi:hypothetical protein
VEEFMHPLNRAAGTACLGLAFLVLPTAAGQATAVPAVGSAPSVATTQCNGDPGIDASNDPVHCHYQHPVPDRKWRAAHHHRY